MQLKFKKNNSISFTDTSLLLFSSNQEDFILSKNANSDAAYLFYLSDRIVNCWLIKDLVTVRKFKLIIRGN